ncbi:hypothetical protein [uncultured Umboniibacter sp.]|uniref:hypothetical protein n=1 Tax=uncultured Umboniibacter sp. TaxID=1798917 RepID=UPI00262A987D|nr:hypothetical protein [uncultured Umboniibacter sp.]
MDHIIATLGGAGQLLQLVMAFFWLGAPIFIFLTYRCLKQIQTIHVATQSEIKELNASIKYLKRRYNESVDK